MNAIRITTVLMTVVFQAMLLLMSVAYAEECTCQVILKSFKISSDGSAPVVQYIPPESLQDPIRLRFSTDQDTPVNQQSIRVRYGRMKINITERIREFVELNRHGISVDSSALKIGKHLITIQVADILDRRTTVTMSLVVWPCERRCDRNTIGDVN